jgi:mannitol 2-dehydrogenase
MHSPAEAPVQLNQNNLHLVPPKVSIPAYSRQRGKRSIVHVGVGAFHRAHQAVYLDDLLASVELPEWEICGVGLLAQDQAIHTALKMQDCLYTVVELNKTHIRARVIGSLLEHLYAQDSPEAVIARMTDPECRIVSLTITEGGYCVNQWTGKFDYDHPEVRHDLEHPREPICWLGYLAEALDRRRRRELPPFTVLSCDNLQHNGDVARKAVLAFAERRDPSLSKWLETHGAFPNSMVDRITPVTTDEQRSMVAQEFGIQDACPVVTEPFRQWIIEDRFCNGRPQWEHVGALMTSDVVPYEKIKIRLLNASHQALCYLGLLLGYEYVHEAIEDEQIQAFIRRLMDEEVSPLLPKVPGIDLGDYKRTLVERFANPAIKDRLSRIGTDASTRISKFVLPSIAEQAGRGGPTRLLSLAVAGWLRCLAGTDDRGRRIDLVDPLATTLTGRARLGGPDPGPLLGVKEVFGDVLPANREFRTHLSEALRGLCENGARATLAVFVQPDGYQQQ